MCVCVGGGEILIQRSTIIHSGFIKMTCGEQVVMFHCYTIVDTLHACGCLCVSFEDNVNWRFGGFKFILLTIRESKHSPLCVSMLEASDELGGSEAQGEVTGSTGLLSLPLRNS